MKHRWHPENVNEYLLRERVLFNKGRDFSEKGGQGTCLCTQLSRRNLCHILFGLEREVYMKNMVGKIFPEIHQAV